MNRELQHIITKSISIHQRDWGERLAEAVWAYRVTWKTSTGFTPFQLVYGKSAVMPIELEIKILKMATRLNLCLDKAQQTQLEQLHQLDEYRQEAVLRMELVQNQRKKWHDVHLRSKTFEPGKRVLLYDSRYNNFLGKFQIKWMGPYQIQQVFQNGTVQLQSIDGSDSTFRVNGYRLREYHKTVSREHFMRRRKPSSGQPLREST